MKSCDNARPPRDAFSCARVLWGACARVLLVALAPALFAVSTYAQRQPDPNEAYRVLMERRMRETQQAVSETIRRRFEEGKGGGSFPSDANKVAGKPGLVRAVSPEERTALAHTAKGLDYFSKSKFELAVKEYDEAIRVFPELAAAHNNRGSALFALGRFEEAAASFRSAVKLDPRYAQAHFNLALALIKLGLEREANESLARAADAYVVAGDEQLLADRLEEAEESYKGLLQIDPEYPIAHFKLGLVHIAAHKYDDAVASFRRVLRKNPDSADAHEGLGEALLGQHKYAEAAAAADRAAQLRPDSAGAHYLAGLAHASLGQRDEASASLARLKQLKADDFARLLSEFIEKKTPDKR